MTAAAWVQAIATVALILVTAWYVYHTWRIAQRTAQAADGARESAQAAKEMVGIERQRMILSQKPDVAVSIRGAGDQARCASSRAKNYGPGYALRCKGYMRVEFGDAHEECEAPLPAQIEPDLPAEVDVRYRVGGRLGELDKVVALCHYEDAHGTPDHPRVYHSLYVNPTYLTIWAGRSAKRTSRLSFRWRTTPSSANTCACAKSARRHGHSHITRPDRSDRSRHHCPLFRPLAPGTPCTRNPAPSRPTSHP